MDTALVIAGTIYTITHRGQEGENKTFSHLHTKTIFGSGTKWVNKKKNKKNG